LRAARVVVAEVGMAKPLSEDSAAAHFPSDFELPIDEA